MNDASLLTHALTDPASTAPLDAECWTALLTMARAESLLGSLAVRLEGADVPDRVAAILVDARDVHAENVRRAAWEAEMCRRALAPLGIPMVLLKGTAFVVAGLDADAGRSVGDLDILVPRNALDAVEAALLAAGWEWVKADAYDDIYYRRWMHELPPLIHQDRDRLIDVHHTILPLTARPRPNAAALIADRRKLDGGLAILSAEDMVVHAAAHLLADGDLAGGLRNLWDIDRLCRQFSGSDPAFWARLDARADLHKLGPPTHRAIRLAHSLYDTPAPAHWLRPKAGDAWFRRRLLARNGWGQPTRPFTRQAFYIRSHWLRMPPMMLARHLWTKWRKARAAQ